MCEAQPIEPVAIVTALVELEPGIPGARRRSIEDYFRLATDVLAIDLPMVVFCDEQFIDRISEMRRLLAPEAPTAVARYEPHPEAAEDLEFLRTSLGRRRTASTSNQVKDTPEYLAVGWSKPSLLRRATGLIDAGRYWWIDFGIAHTSAVPRGLADALRYDPATLNLPPVHFVSLANGDWHGQPGNFEWTWEGATAGSSDWWLHGAQLVCGGVFGVARGALGGFEQRVREAVAEAYQHDAAVTDEMLFSRVLALFPDATRVTAASYPTLLTALRDDLVPSLRDLCPSARVVELPGPERPDRAALNPSIANHPEGGYAVIIRHANYRYEDGRYTPLDGSGLIKTDNVLARLDDDLRVVSMQPIDDSLARTVSARYPVHGFEDMRLFHHDGAWWVSATVREHRDDGRCEIAACRLDEGGSIVRAFAMASPLGDRHEKNWAPIEGAKRMSFLWNAEPAVIVEVDDVLGATLLPRPIAPESVRTSARGGSQIIAVPGGWLSVVHHAHLVGTEGNERRHYRHRIIYYDAEWNAVASSREFFFQFVGIEFCAGVARHRDGIVLSYGVEDRVARLATISWADLWNMLGLRAIERSVA